MTINAESLPKYFHSIEFPFHVHGKGDVLREELEYLIKIRAVYGIGSWRRLRAIHLDGTPDEIDELIVRDIQAQSELARACLPPLETLLRMVSARKTTYRERIDVKCADGVRAAFLFQHKHCY